MYFGNHKYLIQFVSNIIVISFSETQLDIYHNLPSPLCRLLIFQEIKHLLQCGWLVTYSMSSLSLSLSVVLHCSTSYITVHLSSPPSNLQFASAFASLPGMFPLPFPLFSIVLSGSGYCRFPLFIR